MKLTLPSLLPLLFTATATATATPLTTRNNPADASPKISRITFYSDTGGKGDSETLYALGIGCRNLTYIPFFDKVKSVQVYPGDGSAADFTNAYCYTHTDSGCKSTQNGYFGTLAEISGMHNNASGWVFGSVICANSGTEG